MDNDSIIKYCFWCKDIISENEPYVILDGDTFHVFCHKEMTENMDIDFDEG